ncbi:MAG: hypothetical protein ACI8Z7_000269 [Candidatus Nanohaloarchaea archaeon]|jgi:hypothetical protein
MFAISIEPENIPVVRDYESFEEFIYTKLSEMLEEAGVAESRQKTFSVKRLHQGEKLIIGRVRTGEWGYQEDRYNVETGEREENARDVNDSMEMDFFFLLTRTDGLPEDSAVLILEEFQGKGAKTEFQKQLSDSIESDKIKIEIDPVYTRDVVRQLRKSDNLLRFKLETQKAPKIELNHEERLNGERVSDELDNRTRQMIEIKPGKGGEFPYRLNRLADALEQDEEIGISRLEDFDIADISAVVNDKGSERTISLDDGDTVKMVEVLDTNKSHVKISDGRVKQWSLAKNARGLVDDLEKSYQGEKITNFR